MTPTRIHIVGGPGSGKSTVACRLAGRLRLPLHHLDDIYRVGGGIGAVRGQADRDQRVASVLSGRGWITEGVHLGWTDPFIEQADVVIWLDHLGWRQASRRVVRRFAAGAADGARSSRGHHRFTRVRDYARHLRALGGAIGETRRYHRSERGTPNLPETRAATAERLARRSGPIVRCRSPEDVADLDRRLARG